MGFAANSIWEVQAGGDDAANGGGFDPGNANMATDLVAVTGASTTPVVSSASYNFVAGDVGHWLFVKTGTNWSPGWYKIGSVANNLATLRGGIGAGVSALTMAPTTLRGVATSSAPTGGTWAIDYSQTGAVALPYTDIVVDGSTNTSATSAASPFTVAMIGNVMAVTAGTGFTVQRIQISNVVAGVATADKSWGTTSSTGGTAGLGGALASPGMAGGLMVAGNGMWVNGSGTYSVASASSNVTTGCVTLPAAASATNITTMEGYGSVRGDLAARPLMKASGSISTFSLITGAAGVIVTNMAVDGTSYTSSRGINIGFNSCVAQRCKALNCTNNGFIGTNTSAAILCEGTGCSTQAAFQLGSYYGCAAYSNTANGFFSSGVMTCHDCISVNNTGATSSGFASTSAALFCFNCEAARNGMDGFRAGPSATAQTLYVNCLGSDNGKSASGYNFNAVTAIEGILMINCAGYVGSAAGNIGANVATFASRGFVLLTEDPYVDASNGNFAQNSHTNGGYLLQQGGALAAVPGLPGTISYRGIGAIQYGVARTVARYGSRYDIQGNLQYSY